MIKQSEGAGVSFWRAADVADVSGFPGWIEAAVSAISALVGAGIAVGMQNGKIRQIESEISRLDREATKDRDRQQTFRDEVANKLAALLPRQEFNDRIDRLQTAVLSAVVNGHHNGRD